MSLTLELKKKTFEELWHLYPNKDGKKQAQGYFNASIKTYQDIQQITIALNNYITHLKQESWKKPKSGSTWFNNWKDWDKPFIANELIKTSKSIPLTPERIKDIKMRFSPEYQLNLYHKICNLWSKSKRLRQLKEAPANMW